MQAECILGQYRLKITRLENLITETEGISKMSNLLMSLTLVVASIATVAVTVTLVWCWMNRSRLRDWKF